MNEEEKKAIEVLKNKRPSEQILISGKMSVDILVNLIENQQKELEKNTERINELINEVTLKQCELEKKDKIIDLMANNIADSSNVYENLVNTEFEHTKEEVIEYFTKKASEDNE